MKSKFSYQTRRFERLRETSKTLDDGEIFTLLLPSSECDVCGLLILMHSHRCFSVWSDSGQLTFYEYVQNDASIDSYRDIRHF